jgi:hypothetical protein
MNLRVSPKRGCVILDQPQQLQRRKRTAQQDLRNFLANFCCQRATKEPVKYGAVFGAKICSSWKEPMNTATQRGRAATKPVSWKCCNRTREAFGVRRIPALSIVPW